MSFIVIRKAAACGLCFTLFLTACGGAPSEGEMKAAIEKQTVAQQKQLEAFAGKAAVAMSGDLMPKITGAKKVGCKEDGESAYRCDVEVQVSQNGAVNSTVTQMRFVKGSDGWLLSQ